MEGLEAARGLGSEPRRAQSMNPFRGLGFTTTCYTSCARSTEARVACKTRSLNEKKPKAFSPQLWVAVFPQRLAFLLGRIRGALKREPLLNPLLALLKRDLIQRVYIPKGPPNPIP